MQIWVKGENWFSMNSAIKEQLLRLNPSLEAEPLQWNLSRHD